MWRWGITDASSGGGTRSGAGRGRVYASNTAFAAARASRVADIPWKGASPRVAGLPGPPAGHRTCNHLAFLARLALPQTEVLDDRAEVLLLTREKLPEVRRAEGQG